jgi:hypothetical protein
VPARGTPLIKSASSPDPAVAEYPGDDFGAGAEPQLGANMVRVSVGGAPGDYQRLSDLTARAALGNEECDLTFARRQEVGLGVVLERGDRQRWWRRACGQRVSVGPGSQLAYREEGAFEARPLDLAACIVEPQISASLALQQVYQNAQPAEKCNRNERKGISICCEVSAWVSSSASTIANATTYAAPARQARMTSRGGSVLASSMSDCWLDGGAGVRRTPAVC